MDIKIFNPYGKFVGCFLPNCLLKYHKLSLSAKVLWSRLAQHAGRQGHCYPSQKTLAEELGISERQVINLIGELVKKGFIHTEKPKGKDKLYHKTTRYYFIFHPIFQEETKGIIDINSSFEPETDFTSQPETDFTSIVKESIEKEKDIIEKEEPNSPTFEVTEYLKEKVAELSSNGNKKKASNVITEIIERLNEGILRDDKISNICREVINHLNEKASTHYRPTTPKTKSLISARLKEGFTVDDFKKVIDRKANTWGKDPKMCMYLRPETLFGTKFESYLNEPEPYDWRD